MWRLDTIPFLFTLYTSDIRFRIGLVEAELPAAQHLKDKGLGCGFQNTGPVWRGWHCGQVSTWTINIDALSKKGQSCLFFLRRLRSLCLQDHAADVSSLSGVQHHPLRSREMEQQPENSPQTEVKSSSGELDLSCPWTWSVEESRMLSKSLSITDNVSPPAGLSSFSRGPRAPQEVLLYHLSPFRRRKNHLTVTIYVHISVHNGYKWNIQYIFNLLTYIMHGDIVL